MEHAIRQEPGSLDAWDALLRGMWHYRKATRTDLSRARDFLGRALDLDPNSAIAWACLAHTYALQVSFQWAEAPEEAIGELGRAAARAVELDDTEPLGHLSLALHHLLRGETGKTVERCRLALRLNPGSVDGYLLLGRTLAISGRPDEALACVETAERLSPQDPTMAYLLQVRATAYFAAQRYEEAADSALQSRGLDPGNAFTNGLLAASYGQLGRLEDARSIFRDIPSFSVDLLRQVLSSGSADYVDRLIAGLRKAGLKE